MNAQDKTSAKMPGKPYRGRLAVATIVTMVLALLASAAGYSYWSLASQSLITISAGEVYQTGRWAPNDLLSVAREYGIRTVIDLRDISEVPGVIGRERLAFRYSGIDYINLPAKDLPGNETILDFLSVVAEQQNRPVLLQSEYETGRAAIFAALYRVEFESWDNESARVALETLYSGAAFTPDTPQGEFLLSYKPHGIRLARNAGD